MFLASTDPRWIPKLVSSSVDQGTGTVTFAASIAISNLDGLGFRQGVRITEFSNDDTMADSDPAAVPTEFATENFITRRLHFNRAGLKQITGTIGRRCACQRWYNRNDWRFKRPWILKLKCPRSQQHYKI